MTSSLVSMTGRPARVGAGTAAGDVRFGTALLDAPDTAPVPQREP